MPSIIECEKRILKRMEGYYNSVNKALEWYNEPNMYFQTTLPGTYIALERASPKVMVENDKGEEVLRWIELTIGI